MTISSEVKVVIENVLAQCGCALVLATFRRERQGHVLRVFVERTGADPDAGSGVDLALCATISRDLSAALDVAEVIDRPYTLEVSSPGIERPLVQGHDYERFAGRLVFVKTNRAIDGRRRFKGRLDGLCNGVVTVTARKGDAVAIPFDLIEKANLVFEPKGSGVNPGD
ncbi:MAG: ribosome maturation factor RimP [Myxococcota bacterium]|nr:ribosome maturation factor RimP [Myxococcota bacterium]